MIGMQSGGGKVKLETLVAYLSALGTLQGGKVYVNYEIQRTIDRIEKRIQEGE